MYIPDRLLRAVFGRLKCVVLSSPVSLGNFISVLFGIRSMLTTIKYYKSYGTRQYFDKDKTHLLLDTQYIDMKQFYL